LLWPRPAQAWRRSGPSALVWPRPALVWRCFRCAGPDFATGSYALKITAKAPKPAKAPKKKPATSTWTWGAVELVLLAAVLYGSNRVSRVLVTGRRRTAGTDRAVTAARPGPPATEDGVALLDRQT
jgi:hypothetical protein